jgi:hypothetical protein
MGNGGREEGVICYALCVHVKCNGWNFMEGCCYWVSRVNRIKGCNKLFLKGSVSYMRH